MALASPAFADTGWPYTISVTETDHSPVCQVGQIQFTTGTVTCQGNIAKVVTGGGSGGGSGPLSPGSTNYIQNTLNPTINTQTFSVQQGSFSVTGFIMTDPNQCQWNTTINTSGAVVTSLIGCPVVLASRPCSKGQSLGLMLSITCAGPLP